MGVIGHLWNHPVLQEAQLSVWRDHFSTSRPEVGFSIRSANPEIVESGTEQRCWAVFGAGRDGGSGVHLSGRGKAVCPHDQQRAPE